MITVEVVYARRDEWLVRLTIADGSDAQEVLDGLILWMAAPAPTYATERTETTRPTQSVPSLTHARTSKLQGTGHDSPSAKRSAEDSAVSRP